MKFNGITKRYGAVTVFDDFSLELADGSVTALFGPSGVGKTTLLNIAAGLTDYSGTTDCPRPVSYVFQEQRLVPTLTVLENLTYVLPYERERGFFGKKTAASGEWTAAARKKKAEDMLREVGLYELKDRYPRALSGGQAQRVALARAFLYPSQVLLMDEPFGGLDVGAKEELISLFLRLWRADGRTVIFVTHDVDDGILIATDRVVLGGAPASVTYRSHVDTPPTAGEGAFGADYAAIRGAIVAAKDFTK